MQKLTVLKVGAVVSLMVVASVDSVVHALAYRKKGNSLTQAASR